MYRLLAQIEILPEQHIQTTSVDYGLSPAHLCPVQAALVQEEKGIVPAPGVSLEGCLRSSLRMMR